MLITVRKVNVVEVARVLQEASIRYVFAGGSRLSRMGMSAQHMISILWFA